MWKIFYCENVNGETEKTCLKCVQLKRLPAEL